MILCSSYRKKSGSCGLRDHWETEQGLCETWFGWKKDGSVAIDLGDMTYEETAKDG
jgi:hypothetical protein